MSLQSGDFLMDVTGTGRIRLQHLGYAKGMSRQSVTYSKAQRKQQAALKSATHHENTSSIPIVSPGNALYKITDKTKIQKTRAGKINKTGKKKNLNY